MREFVVKLKATGEVPGAVKAEIIADLRDAYLAHGRDSEQYRAAEARAREKIAQHIRIEPC